MKIIKDELLEVKDRYGDERNSIIEHAADDFTAEDMIPDDEMVLTISHQGYIKRTALVEYRTQGRGGLHIYNSPHRILRFDIDKVLYRTPFRCFSSLWNFPYLLPKDFAQLGKNK